MLLYRELTHDDPHRRRTRSSGASPSKDDGDLFTLRPSPRKLRILIDLESFTQQQSSVDDHLTSFMEHDNIEHVFIRMSAATNPPSSDDEPEPGFVQVRDVTAHKGRFGYPGSMYSWAVSDPKKKFDGTTTLQRRGSLSPEPILNKTLQAHQENRAALPGVDEHSVRRAVLLAEVCRAMSYDLVISETVTTGCAELPVYDRANVVTRAEALPIVAHYMRMQQQYIADATRSIHMSRKTYYHETVAALAQGVLWWQGKCQCAAVRDSSCIRFVADTDSLIDRLSRALRARDALIASIGAIQTDDVLDDGADALDHLLVCLCGAVDVMARSLHTAQQLSGNERNAKLHLAPGYKTLLANYSTSDGKSVLDNYQKYLTVVFQLRNSIHSRTLEAIAALKISEHGITAQVGRLDVLIPDDTADELMNPEVGGLEHWGARRLGDDGPVVADLPQLVDRCFESVLQFLDKLCRIVAAEPVEEKSSVLRLDVIGIRPSSLDCSQSLRLYIGMPLNDNQPDSEETRSRSPDPGGDTTAVGSQS